MAAQGRTGMGTGEVFFVAKIQFYRIRITVVSQNLRANNLLSGKLRIPKLKKAIGNHGLASYNMKC
jgi:hypothetical protein